MTYHVVLVHTPDGITALVPALPGSLSQGKTVEEALANVTNAIEEWLQWHHDDKIELEEYEVTKVSVATVKVRTLTNA